MASVTYREHGDPAIRRSGDPLRVPILSRLLSHAVRFFRWAGDRRRDWRTCLLSGRGTRFTGGISVTIRYRMPSRRVSLLRQYVPGLWPFRRRSRTLPSHLEDFRIAHVGGYWRGVNDVVRQMLLGLEETGASVMEISTDEHPEMRETDGRPYDRGGSGPVWINKRAFLRAAGDFDPHVIVCNAGGLAFRDADSAELRRKNFIVGISLSDPDVFPLSTSIVSRNCDLFFTNAASCIPDYRSLGVNAHILHFGTSEAFYHPVSSRPEFGCDVLVFGSGYPHRAEPVRELVRHFDTHVYGGLWDLYGIPTRGFLFGEQSLAALNSARLTVVFGRTSLGAFIVKPYLFDYLAAGATVLTEFVEGVDQYFEYGKELIGFSSSDDLIAKVRYYLDRPHEAKAIGAAGRARVLRDHTWKQRWPNMLNLLRPISGPPPSGGRTLPK